MEEEMAVIKDGMEGLGRKNRFWRKNQKNGSRRFFIDNLQGYIYTYIGEFYLLI
jgi:hypothetical protein